jgi:outer membrane protein OmpA-like peptidoglycan-associated protein
MKISATIACMACALAAAAPATGPAAAQDKPSLQELLGRAQSQSERKAVEDLIDKLKPAPKQQRPVETAKPEVKVQEQQKTQEAKPATGETEKAASAPATETKIEEQAATAREQAPAAEKQAPVEAASKTETEPAAKSTPVPVEVAVEQAERKQLPSVDLEVLFEFDSARMTPDAVEALTPLGRALSDPRLADGQFLIAGHTDGKGRASYNQELSQRRAEAVREFLIVNFKIDGSRLVAQGFGESRLKNPQQPRAAENRRVQVVNLTSAAASR